MGCVHNSQTLMSVLSANSPGLENRQDSGFPPTSFKSGKRREVTGKALRAEPRGRGLQLCSRGSGPPCEAERREEKRVSALARARRLCHTGQPLAVCPALLLPAMKTH